ncbi:T9SS type A sorting domain-containing protein [Kordia sp.]|uniref:T9SS type A sorting domain-containing protein n=1 Tax=Kordia sp. TaxID=1965332 RepID=UPI003B596BB7
MTKKILVFFAFISATLFLNAQCGPSYTGATSSGSGSGGEIPNFTGMSFTTSASCGGILTSITSTVLGSPIPNATVSVRLYEGDGLGGNVIGELTGVPVNGSAVYDFSALMITMNPSTTYTYIIEKENTSDSIFANFVFDPIHPGGTAYWGGVPSNIAITFSVSIDNSTLSVTDVDTDETELRVYPNPAANSIQLTSLQKAENYTILDISGKKVMEGTINVNQSINIQQLTKGMYFIQLEKRVLKFVKK